MVWEAATTRVSQFMVNIFAIQEYNGAIYFYDMKTGEHIMNIDAARSLHDEGPYRRRRSPDYLP